MTSINRGVTPGLMAGYSEDLKLNEEFASMQELRNTFTKKGMGAEDAIIRGSQVLIQDALLSELYNLLGVNSYCESSATPFAYFEEPEDWKGLDSTVFSYDILPSVLGAANRLYHFSVEEFCSTMRSFYKNMEKETVQVGYEAFLQLLQGVAPLSKNQRDIRSFIARLLPG